jgi:flagellar biosynthesis/type III secretory pathway protein FliH
MQTRQTRDDPEARYRAKRALVWLMYRQGWERQRVLELFAVLDWMMHLPDTLSQRLWQDNESIEGETRMRYVTSIERLAIARGMQKGMEQGLEKGMQHGKREEAAAIVAKLLTKRFGPLPESVRARMAQATLEQLDEWAERLLDAPSLEAVLGGH